MWMTSKKWKKTGKWILSQNLKRLKKREREILNIVLLILATVQFSCSVMSDFL